MKKIYTAIIAMIIASLVFVLSGCEMSFDLGEKTPEDTQSHTAFVEVTDDNGQVVATEMVTISKDEIKKAENFFEKDKKSENAETGVSPERIEEAIENNKNIVSTTVSGDNTKPTKNQANSGNSTTSTTIKQNSGSNKPDNKPNTSYVQDDAAVIASSQYMIIGRHVSNGVVTQQKLARSGSKMALFSEFEGKQLGVVVTEDYVMLLSVDEKTYIELTKEMLKENLSEDELAMFDGSALDADKVVTETTQKTEDGVEYTVVSYKNGQQDYFIGKTIIKTVYSDGSILYYDSVSAVVPASVFKAPSGYKKTTLDQEGVSDFAGIIDATEAHSHDE